MDLCYQRQYMIRKNHLVRCTLSQHYLDLRSTRCAIIRKPNGISSRAKRLAATTVLALPDDSVTVNGIPQASSSSSIEDARSKLDQSLKSEDLNSGLVQSIHDAARTIERAFVDHNLLSKGSWLSMPWLGGDKTMWVKSLSYQAAVDSIMQAIIEISSQGDGRDRDVNLFIQRSLSRLRSPLEGAIQEQLSQKQPKFYEWYIIDQSPVIVTSFVNLLEEESGFSASTILCYKNMPGSLRSRDTELLILSLSCLAAITKLGSTKISCQKFLMMVPDTIGRLMDKLLELLPISEAYQSMKDIGLHREFLTHFGPIAALNDHGAEELSFWVNLIQNKLRRAIDREKIWSRLTTIESIEVLEKDLAIFGFFIALGRSTQSYLSKSGVTTVSDSISTLIRYLIGGSVLYYPQLSSISSYQLYVEVVCEELEWLPFYACDMPTMTSDGESKENSINNEVVSTLLDVCSYWMTSFIKYSSWLENPSHIKAARFLSRGHVILNKCSQDPALWKSRKHAKADLKDYGSIESGGNQLMSELDSFDKALESVEEAVVRLENLLQELHVSNSNSGKEHLQAACSDLEKIRKLKKEAEFLEASFRAKAASLEQADANDVPLSTGLEEYHDMTNKTNSSSKYSKQEEKVESRPRGFWSFLVRSSIKKSEPGADTIDDSMLKARDDVCLKSNDIHRFEKLRNELIELERRVQKSADDALNEDVDTTDDQAPLEASEQNIAPAGATYESDDFISKSMKKIKDTTTDVWQGTQLLAIDSAAAMDLLKRSVTGDELTEKERKALQRTLTDLASVVPIGILMLLPVTAVGHAAMLAFIQRYIPSLIPSTYAPERLDLLRQLEKVKQMSTSENTDELAEVVPLSSEIK